MLNFIPYYKFDVIFFCIHLSTKGIYWYMLALIQLMPTNSQQNYLINNILPQIKTLFTSPHTHQTSSSNLNSPSLTYQHGIHHYNTSCTHSSHSHSLLNSTNPSPSPRTGTIRPNKYYSNLWKSWPIHLPHSSPQWNSTTHSNPNPTQLNSWRLHNLCPNRQCLPKSSIRYYI